MCILHNILKHNLHIMYIQHCSGYDVQQNRTDPGQSSMCHFRQVTKNLTLSQATNFRLFQTQSACRRQFQI